MIIISGRTYELRDRLRLLGGRYIETRKDWEFISLSQEERKELIDYGGITITDNDKTEYSAPVPQRKRIIDGTRG